MSEPSIVLIHPPVAKPSEPPAGIARLAGALRSHGARCRVIDANIGGLHYLLGTVVPADDTWSRRAHRHLQQHLQTLRNSAGYRYPAPYHRAVADIGRLLAMAGSASGVRVGLADYRDEQLMPLRSADLQRAAQEPQRNPYYDYFQKQLLPLIIELNPMAVGLSINYLSQGLCAFALIGLIKKRRPGTKIILGGGLISSWLSRPGRDCRFSALVDRMVSGPGEAELLKEAGQAPKVKAYVPDYGDLAFNAYLSPGLVLPFSASDGCWWRRCVFCPERAERRPFHPLPHSAAIEQLRRLVTQTAPTMIHLLDNAISPALLRGLADHPPGAPWYGFVRIGAPLDDFEFCRRLAVSGCAMLKLGLESGSQQVLDRLHKGVRLGTASKVLRNLHKAGIATYVYLLFGTPAENEPAAHETLAFVVDHAEAIHYLNSAIFNLPVGSPDAGDLKLRNFYDGDLALYHDFTHPSGWDRAAVRRFVEKIFKKHPVIQPIIRNDPPVFTSNHAAFFSLYARR